MKIDHVQLACPPGGEERARAFFGGPLEMEEVEKPEPLRARGGCWFRKDGVDLHIGVEEGFAPQEKAHPAFAVSDLDSVAERLLAAGCPVKWDEALTDRRRFFTADPFGNRIEFLAK